MKVSIITVAFNSAPTIADTLKSVATQSHPEIEHIVIDGASRDATMQIVDQYPHLARVTSEPDKGIYDAMNKGLSLATGEIVGFLNSDDFYCHPNVIEKIAAGFSDPKTDAVFADAQFVKPSALDKVVRRYSSRHFSPQRIGWGWMPAHPTLFFRRAIYQRHGSFQTDFRIAGDFEFIARAFAREKLQYRYLEEVMVTMRTGGASTGGLSATLRLNREVRRACLMNGISTNYLKLGSKYLRKMLEFVPAKFHLSRTLE